MSDFRMSGGYCPNCGKKTELGDAFCVNCGAKLTFSDSSAPGGDSTPTAFDGRAASAPSAESPKKKPGPINRLLSVALIAVFIWAIVSWIGDNFVGEGYTDYASAGKAAATQMVDHKSPVIVAFNVDGFKGELSPYKAGETKLALNLLSDDVMMKMQKASFTYDGDPRHGDHLALVCSPVERRSYLTKQGIRKLQTLNLSIKTEYYTTAEQDKEFDTAVKKVLAQLRVDGMSDYEKVRAIYKYICSNVTYDEAHLNDDGYTLKYTGYAALKNHTAVCAGVADLFYYMANTAGLEARVVTSSTHAWNFVKLGGKCYYLDATWDLGKGETEYQFFLKGKYDFNHFVKYNLSLFGFGNQLTDTDKGYTFSDYAYGRL